MNTRSIVSALFGAFGGAVAVAAAVRTRRQPQARDLRTLGIDPEQFRRIRY